jgi:hypothetical protein
LTLLDKLSDCDVDLRTGCPQFLDNIVPEMDKLSPTCYLHDSSHLGLGRPL